MWTAGAAGSTPGSDTLRPLAPRGTRSDPWSLRRPGVFLCFKKGSPNDDGVLEWVGRDAYPASKADLRPPSRISRRSFRFRRDETRPEEGSARARPTASSEAFDESRARRPRPSLASTPRRRGSKLNSTYLCLLWHHGSPVRVPPTPAHPTLVFFEL